MRPVTPAQTSDSKELHFVLSISILKQIANNKITIIMQPINPMVCPAYENIKSFCDSETKMNSFSFPLNKPFPHNPPLCMAFLP